MKNLFILFILIPKILFAADTQQDNYYKLCDNSGIAHNTYKMILFSEIPERREASWVEAVPYHYLAFYADNYYSYIASTTDIIKAEQLSQLLQQWTIQKSHILRYTLDNTGDLIMYDNNTPKYRYRCMQITQNHEQYKKGDIILTGYTKNSESKLYKLYRKWF